MDRRMKEQKKNAWIETEKNTEKEEKNLKMFQKWDARALNLKKNIIVHIW